ncbi:MAG TPA: cell division protein FtsA [Candidatus Paceibacterota bacterium]|nr:cell division protein FtsA [Candidatus Paceibacterota bacterium]
MNNIITGLDIGTSSIKCVVAARKKDGSLSVVSAFTHRSAGIMKGVLSDPDEALKVFRKIIVDLNNISKKATQNIFISVNGKHIKSKPSKGIVAVSRADQEIQQDDIDRVIQASKAINEKNYTVLHNVITEFAVDDVGDIRSPIGMTGSRLEVSTLIIKAFAPRVNQLLDTIKKAGGEVTGVVFVPFASEKAVLSKRQKELGVVLVDFGGGTTSLAAWKEGKVIHARSLPVGSDYVTNDIAVGLKIPVDIAEKLKKIYGYALSKEVSRKDKIKLSEFDSSVDEENDVNFSKRFLSEIIEVRLEEILGLVSSELEEISDSVQFPAGVVICGGGVKISGMDDLVKQELKLSVEMGYPRVEELEISNPTYKELIEDPEFSAAVGLVVWGNEELDVPSNPVSFLKNVVGKLIP